MVVGACGQDEVTSEHEGGRIKCRQYSKAPRSDYREGTPRLTAKNRLCFCNTSGRHELGVHRTRVGTGTIRGVAASFTQRVPCAASGGSSKGVIGVTGVFTGTGENESIGIGGSGRFDCLGASTGLLGRATHPGPCAVTTVCTRVAALCKKCAK